MEVKMAKTWLIASTFLFASSLFAMGKSEITKLKTTLHEQSRVIYSAATTAEAQLATIEEAQTIIKKFIEAESSGKTSEHLFVGIRFENVVITESTRAHIMQKLEEMHKVLDIKKKLLRKSSHEARHQEELEEMLSHINVIEQDHQGLAQRLLEILNRTRS